MWGVLEVGGELELFEWSSISYLRVCRSLTPSKVDHVKSAKWKLFSAKSFDFLNFFSGVRGYHYWGKSNKLMLTSCLLFISIGRAPSVCLTLNKQYS